MGGGGFKIQAKTGVCWDQLGTMLAHFLRFGRFGIKIVLIGGNHNKNCGFQAIRTSENRTKSTLGTHLDLSWARVGPVWACLGLSWPVLGLSWPVLACLDLS